MTDSDQTPAPPNTAYQQLIDSTNQVYRVAQAIIDTWRRSLPTTSPAKGTDPDEYVRPMLTAAELVRRQRLPDVLVQLYDATLKIVDEHCAHHKIRLHKGAVYGNLAIALIERGLYSRAISYLHAAAQEDLLTYPNVKDVFSSNALSPNGMFGQWLDLVQKQIPGAVDNFLGGIVGDRTPGKDFCLWCAGHADLRLLAAVIEYDGVRGLNDPQAASVRLECLRDLAALVEVTWKRVGSIHLDGGVQAVFVDPPPLAALICHMHFAEKRQRRRNNPALNANKATGLLWNAIEQSSDVLDAIDSHIDHCGDRARSMQDVAKYLNSVTVSNHPNANEIAKRLLLAYRIRNETAHSFEPQNPGFVANADWFFEWLLGANLYTFQWARESGQVKL